MEICCPVMRRRYRVTARVSPTTGGTWMPCVPSLTISTPTWKAWCGMRPTAPLIWTAARCGVWPGVEPGRRTRGQVRRLRGGRLRKVPAPRPRVATRPEDGHLAPGRARVLQRAHGYVSGGAQLSPSVDEERALGRAHLQALRPLGEEPHGPGEGPHPLGAELPHQPVRRAHEARGQRGVHGARGQHLRELAQPRRVFFRGRPLRGRQRVPLHIEHRLDLEAGVE